MIDIHSHVLPCLDDGAGSPGQALDMVRAAAAAGTTDLVATPHANEEFQFHPDRVRQAIADLQAEVGETPRIHYGCELHFTLENIESAVRLPERYSINHHCYLLVELSEFVIPRTTGEILSHFVDNGIQPILVHPERNHILQKKLPDLEAWIRQGCLVQVTAQSLTGRFGRTAKATADYLLDRSLAHFIASDGHDGKNRPPVLDEAWHYVENRYDTATAERLMVANPKAALSGTPLESAAVHRKGWFSRR